MAVYREEKGLTLIELLIAMVIAILLTTAAYRAFSSQQKAYTIQEQVTEMQQALRATTNMMVREIRMAGFIAERDEDGRDNDDIDSDAVEGTTGQPFPDGLNEDIEWAANDAICFEADIDNDRRTDIIMYSENANGELIRDHWRWNGLVWQNLGSQNVSENFLDMDLTYFISNGVVWNPAIMGKDAIRMVRLDLEFRTLKEDPDYLAGEDINGDLNDGTCRTRSIVRNIKLRNMSMSGL